MKGENKARRKDSAQTELERGEDQVQQPSRGASQAIEKVLGLPFMWSSLPCCILRLCLCSKVADRLLFSYLLLVELRKGLSSYIVCVTGISTCRNLWVVSSQTLGCCRTCELPPVFGKFCMMDGVIGLSGLGAGVPCIYETRDDELPGSSPVGSSSHLFSHLIGACNNIAQAL